MGLRKKKTSLGAKAKIRSKSLHVTKVPVSQVSATESLESRLLSRANNKLQKKLAKSLDFAEKIKLTAPTSNNTDRLILANNKQILNTTDENYKNFDRISKSAIRRRKKKLRDNLKPKMSDLLDTLNTLDNVGNANRALTQTNDTQRPTYIPSKIRAHIPNPHKNKNVKSLIENIEKKNFSSVLASQDFKTSPFASLKDKISKNLGNFQ